MAQRRTPYVSVNLTVPARDAVQRAALDYSAQMGKRLPMSTIVVAALAIARQHDADVLAAIAAEQDAESNQQEGAQS